MGETSSPEPKSQSTPGVEPSDITKKLIETGFSRQQKIWSHEDNPNLIFREGESHFQGSLESKNLQDRRELLTQALLKLPEYGIQVAGIGSVRDTCEPNKTSLAHGLGLKWETVYLVTQRIEGKQMKKNMSEIPAPVVMRTMDAMLRYYEDMLKEDEPGTHYLSDICFDQMVYGRAPGDEADSVYFVDLETEHISSEKNFREFHNPIGRIRLDIQRMEELYHREFPEYGERLDDILFHLIKNGR